MPEKSIPELLKFSIINLDKSSGPTSFSVSDFVRKALEINKTSHLGTLDPAVSGVLPILLGRACRLNDFFMHKNKTYVGIMRLHKESISDKELEEAINKNIGKISQMPPVKSAVKRQIRERTVHSFKVLERQEKDILFLTEVQAGTYIRTLCVSIGKEIGGAHMLELRRTNASIFSEEDSRFVNLYDLEKAISEYKSGSEELLRKILIPAEEAIQKVMPSIKIKEESIKQILTGKPLMKSDIQEDIPKEEIFAIFCKEKFIAIMKKTSENELIAKALFVYN